MSENIFNKSKFIKLWPLYLVAFLWTIFSLWICIKENQILWSLLLVPLGFIPLLWEIFISPNIKEIEIITYEEQLNLSEKNIFSLDGRIRRRTYWTRALVVVIINFIVIISMDANSPITPLISLLLNIFMLIQGVKRMHDLNKSGFYILIPIYNLILTLTEGTKGSNKYGKDPKN